MVQEGALTPVLVRGHWHLSGGFSGRGKVNVLM